MQRMSGRQRFLAYGAGSAHMQRHLPGFVGYKVQQHHIPYAAVLSRDMQCQWMTPAMVGNGRACASRCIAAMYSAAPTCRRVARGVCNWVFLAAATDKQAASTGVSNACMRACVRAARARGLADHPLLIGRDTHAWASVLHEALADLHPSADLQPT